MQAEYQNASDHAVMARWGTTLDPRAEERVIELFHAIRADAPWWLENLHPGYNSLQVDFDPGAVSHSEVRAYLRGLAPVIRAADSPLVRVPVVYDGPDLADVAAHCGVSPATVIDLHAAAEYRVAFLGFMPGFAYLSGLPAALETPRLAVPRKAVPAGSVAIGGAQTGIYPAASPGGWRIIGHTDLKLDPDWIAPGGRVRFIPA